jgi:hypothetical protein
MLKPTLCKHAMFSFPTTAARTVAQPSTIRVGPAGSLFAAAATTGMVKDELDDDAVPEAGAITDRDTVCRGGARVHATLQACAFCTRLCKFVLLMVDAFIAWACMSRIATCVGEHVETLAWSATMQDEPPLRQAAAMEKVWSRRTFATGSTQGFGPCAK